MLVSFNGSGGDIPRLIGVKLSSTLRNTDKATLGVIRVETKISYCSGIEVTSFVGEEHTTTLRHRTCRESKTCSLFRDYFLYLISLNIDNSYITLLIVSIGLPALSGIYLV